MQPSTSGGQCSTRTDERRPIYLVEENAMAGAVTKNISSHVAATKTSAYNQGPENPTLFNNKRHMEPIGNPQMNNYPVDTFIQLNQQESFVPHTTMAPQFFHNSSSHSNMTQQAASLVSHIPIYTTMNNAPVYSTPVTGKRGRNDTSGNSETNVPALPPRAHQTPIFTSKQMTNKRLRGTTDRVQTEEGIFNQPDETHNGLTNVAQPQPSTAACRFVNSRFPFAPFSIVFHSKVRDKIVVDSLIQHARENHNFELRLVAFRCGSSENSEYRVLVFVENSQSFAFLYDGNNWPTKLADIEFTLKKPSIPPQLSMVLPSVSLYVDWEEFVMELKEKIPSIVNVIRFKNKDQQPLRSVKVELVSAEARDKLLDDGEVSIMHMKYKVVEYFAQAKVLICSNCYRIGHFRKNCPQGDEATCKTCGEKSGNLKEHQCSCIIKCIHCGGAHSSNDMKCSVVKDYQAALTRNLLKEPAPTETRNWTRKTNPIGNTTEHYRSYSTVAMSNLTNIEEMISQKLDTMINKFQAEFVTTRCAIAEIKDKMQTRYTETNNRVDLVEQKVNSVEQKLEAFSRRTYTLFENICTALLDPEGVHGSEWKSYWQDQVDLLIEFRSSQPKAAYG